MKRFSRYFLSSVLVVGLLSNFPQASYAEDRNNLEADLFGSAETDTSVDTSTDSSSNRESDLFGSSSAEDDLFGGSSSSSSDSSFKDLLSEKLDAKDAQFDIGGTYYHSLNFQAANSQETGEVGLGSDGTVDLYFDAALDDSLRFFLKQKITHDFTEGGNDDGGGAVVDFSGTQASTSIDQLWLKFNYQSRLYVTAGKQPTSWGSGFVWAPTDFINSVSASPFSLSDQRLGVSLIKFQYPLDKEGINLYAVFQTTGVSVINDVRSLFRAEFIGEQSEFALSLSTRANEEFQVGFDLSMGAGFADIFVNAAVTHHDTGYYVEEPPAGTELDSDDFLAATQGAVDAAAGVTPDPADPADANTTTLLQIDRSGEALAEVSAGFIYINSLEDDSQVLVNGEFFYNEKGYESSDFLTLYLLQNNFEFDPLYFSKRYAALGVTHSGLGDKRKYSLSLQHIKNLSDSTGALVFAYSTRPFRDLSLSTNLVVLTGHDGTFRPFVNDAPELQITAERIANGELELPAGVQVPANQAATGGTGGQDFDIPRYILNTQLSLNY